MKNWMDVELTVRGKNNQILNTGETYVTISGSEEFCFSKEGALVAGFVPQIKVKNKAQIFNCYLYHMRSNFSIQSAEGAIVYRPREHQGNPVIPLLKKPIAWGLQKEEIEGTTWFKMLMLTKPFDHFQLLQSGIQEKRTVLSRWKPAEVADDWFCWNFKVSMNRK